MFPHLAMQASMPLPQPTLNQLVSQIFDSRRITRAAQQSLMQAALKKEHLSAEEQVAVNRVFNALRQGLIRVV